MKLLPWKNRSILIILLAALLLAFSIFAACQPAENEPIPTAPQQEETRPTCGTAAAQDADATATVAPTATPAPTATSTPTAIPTPSILVNPALSDAQRQALISAAQPYISPSQAEADATVKAMNYASGANASLTCGPLAAAILQDAGLLSPYFNLNEFWLASPLPEKNESLFKEAFPPARYEWLRDETPMAEMDFTANPLQAGDFIYTFGGNYEHMFVVTRVDESGRAYTVQNIERGYLTEDPNDISFVIEETLLYDPNQPGEGVIYKWADYTYWKLGLTGTKGYQRFRPITPIPENTPARQSLSESIDAITTSAGGDWHILIETLSGKSLYERRPDSRIHPASVIKVPIVMGTFQLLESEQTETNTLAEQLQHGPIYNTSYNDRSYEQLLSAVLVNSEEDAADILEENLQASPLKPVSLFSAWGAPTTSLTPRFSTAREMNTLFRALYNAEGLSEQSRAYILDLMQVYTANDDLRLGKLKTVLGKDTVLYNKRGSLLIPLLIVADAGIVEYQNEVYFIQIYAYYDENQPATYETLEAAIGDIAIAFGQWLLNPAP